MTSLAALCAACAPLAPSLSAASVEPIAVVAAGACNALAGPPARCTLAGQEVRVLDIAGRPAQALQACEGPQRCTPLKDALAAPPSARLLLRTPVALLDDLQSAVVSARTGARVSVEPVFARPEGAASRPLAPGVRYVRSATRSPRPMVVHVVEVDLDAPGLSFVVTPGRPDAGMEFVAEKTSDFAAREGLLVAVNAGYFLPFSGGRLMSTPYVPAIGQAAGVDGLSISGGHIDSPWENADPRVDSALCLSGTHAAITRAPCPGDTREAVGAGPQLLHDAALAPAIAAAGAAGPDYYTQPQPRTAIGLNPQDRKLWFVVVDGRQPGYSEGIALNELAERLRALGATQAINFDGGGSTTLVLGDGHGAAQVANSPIHTAIPGRERPVANHLGLRITRPAP